MKDAVKVLDKKLFPNMDTDHRWFDPMGTRAAIVIKSHLSDAIIEENYESTKLQAKVRFLFVDYLRENIKKQDETWIDADKAWNDFLECKANEAVVQEWIKQVG